MYIREESMRNAKIRNFILFAIAFFEIASSVAIMVSLIAYYWGDFATVLGARALPDCIVNVIIGTALFCVVCKSRKRIGDAYFYSGYFELDLNGYITYEELAEVTGKTLYAVRNDLFTLRKSYMQKYELQKVDGKEQVVLDSKTCVCVCKNCGAMIEKRIYFTGTCSYCGSSDLFANVLTDEKFYSISNRMSKGVKKPEFYQADNITSKLLRFLTMMTVSIGIMFISLMAILDQSNKYKDKEYLEELLLSGEHPASFDLIKADILETAIWFAVILIVFGIVAFLMWRRTKWVAEAKQCSEGLAQSQKPFVQIDNMMKALSISDKNKTVRKMNRVLRRGYLRNCTLEVHDDILKVALAKTITKDKCPSCQAAIVGAVDEHYKCEYCGNVIMDVVKKKEL